MLAMAMASQIEGLVGEPSHFTDRALLMPGEHILHIWDTLLKFLATANLRGTSERDVRAA